MPTLRITLLTLTTVLASAVTLGVQSPATQSDQLTAEQHAALDRLNTQHLTVDESATVSAVVRDSYRSIAPSVPEVSGNVIMAYAQGRLNSLFAIQDANFHVAPHAKGASGASTVSASAQQWVCLDNLWTRESGWQVDALNKESKAYGIPQALPATKMATTGADWRTNYRTQIDWGLTYIMSRYGSPCAAWQHEIKQNWY